jgi:predicted metal-dependent peptidase
MLDSPFWGAMAVRLQLREDPKCATLWTQGKELGYNPEWVSKTQVPLVKGVIAKLVMHICAGHTWRQGPRNYSKWNKACSLAVNPYLLEEGFTLPKDCEVREEFRGMYAEAIYAQLEDESPEPEETPPEGHNTGGDEPAKGNHPPSPGPENGAGDPQPGKGAADKPVVSNSGEVRQCDQKEADDLRQDWEVAVAQAQSMGDAPASALLASSDGLHSPVAWQELLREAVERGMASQDYDWMSPSQEYLARGLYVPGLSERGVEFMVVARDTSGSISPATLAQFNAQVRSVFEDIRPTRAAVLDADSDIAQVQDLGLEELEDFSRNAKGGGGTSFVPVFDWAKSQDEPCRCLVYLTDLMGKFPKEDPGFPVVWVVPKTTLYRAPEPPFGEVVFIPPAQAF